MSGERWPPTSYTGCFIDLVERMDKMKCWLTPYVLEGHNGESYQPPH